MEWRTQGLCPSCARRLPIPTPSYQNVGLTYEGHEKCVHTCFTERRAPAEPFNRFYPIFCVSRFNGGGHGNLCQAIAGSNLEHKILSIGNREVKCMTFEEILRHSADCISKPAWRGLGPFIVTSRNKVFRRLEDAERLCFLDSARFRKLWKHQEKENT